MVDSDDVLIRIDGRIGRITLNRPQALHALNQGMCDRILAALRSWRDDDAVAAVVVDHAAGTRGFCAGGDIRMLAESGAADGAEAFGFFQSEYRMNAAIKSFPKPYVAILDGITMGGGVGLSVHGSHRIATERTVFAMPETGIGLFPDVGGGWFLPRLAGELGVWLALSGARLKGGDVAAAGIATHLIASDAIEGLIDQCIETGGDVDLALEACVQNPGPGSFAAQIETINRCFAFDRAEEIVEALERDGHDWARDQAAILKSKSPRTVKVALRQMREGAALTSFEDNMRMEYRIARRQVMSADFQEGVRAVIVDKDNTPLWSPDTLESVSSAVIDEVFAPLGAEELTF
ncbi:MAG: enoyl-CoA hydratase/isomerase family protein [Pseudomonadota bacterium]